MIADLLAPPSMPRRTSRKPGRWELVESKTFGKVKDEAFAGMMIAVITDPMGTAYLVMPDLFEILTLAGSQDVSLRSRPMNRTLFLLLLDSIDERGGVKQLAWL